MEASGRIRLLVMSSGVRMTRSRCSDSLTKGSLTSEFAYMNVAHSLTHVIHIHEKQKHTRKPTLSGHLVFRLLFNI